MQLSRLLKLSLAAGLFAAAVGTSFAAGNPASERQALMKNVGAATKAGASIAKGEVEFDLVAAQLVLHTMNGSALGFGYMFPAGSETGSETEASPKIWEDRAGFDAAVNKFVADTSAKVTDLDSFKAAFGAATANCSSCHKAWRVKK